MFAPLNTAPVMRRHRRTTRATRTPVIASAAAAASPMTTAASTPISSTESVISASTPITDLPHAEPCYNYFDIFPEEVGAVGNVAVTDAEEAQLWQLVGRVVPAAQAEKEGGCVKVQLANMAAPVYYCITDSDDVVYGRAAYVTVPAVATMKPAVVSQLLKNEPSVFSDGDSEACSAEEENESSSACCSPCISSASMRCVYPTECAAH